MNLKKLAHFLAVVEAKSFRKASEKVHLSQPALSRSLQSLEEEFGIPLFDRRYGHVVPTAYSSPILARVRKLMAEARLLEDAVRQVKGLEEGEIRVGFGPFAAVTAMGPVVRDIVSRYPKLRIRVELSNSGHLLELLKQERLDVVVGDSRYASEHDDVAVIEMPRQSIAFLVGRDHELARGRRRFELVDLKDYASAAPTLPEDLLKSLRQSGLPDFPTITCDEMRVLLELAENSPLIAMVPQRVADAFSDQGKLARLSIDLPFDRYAHPCIMTTSGRTLGPAAMLLIELVRERFGVAPQKTVRA